MLAGVQLQLAMAALLCHAAAAAGAGTQQRLAVLLAAAEEAAPASYMSICLQDWQCGCGVLLLQLLHQVL
jgi:hypothetical protein